MDKKMILRKIACICLVILLNFFFCYVFASSWYKPAKEWFENGETNTYLDESVLSELANLVEVAGTGIIAIATVVIGVKYVLGSVTEKASAKENLITLLVACLFFFGWSNIRGILIAGATFSNSGAVTNITKGGFKLTIIDFSNGFEGIFSSIFGLVLTIAQIIAILATMYMGVKYVFSGAESKAKLKEKSIGYIVGIIMIFTTINFVKFISSAITGMF